MTKLEAIAKQQIHAAIKGDLKAMALIMRAIEPRELQQKDDLSPILQAMRAIHAKHEDSSPDAKQATAGGHSAGDSHRSSASLSE